MAYKVKFRQRATDDLHQIWQHIAQDSEVYATAVAASLVEAIEDLDEYPRLGHPVEYITAIEARELPVYPYRVFYLIEEEAIWILAIAHGARDLQKSFFDRLR